MLLQDYKKLFEHTDQVKAIYKNGQRVWPSILPPPPEGNDVPFSMYNNNVETQSIFYTSQLISDFDLYYSIIDGKVQAHNKDINWTKCTESTIVWNSGQTLCLAAVTNSWNSKSIILDSSIPSGSIIIYGNMMSLIYGPAFTGYEIAFPQGSDHNFYRIFNDSSTRNIICTEQYEADTMPIILPVKSLTSWCYTELFNLCPNIKYVKCTATENINVSFSTTSWLSNSYARGTFIKAAGIEWPTGTNGIPSGWTVIEA